MRLLDNNSSHCRNDQGQWDCGTKHQNAKYEIKGRFFVNIFGCTISFMVFKSRLERNGIFFFYAYINTKTKIKPI